MMKARALSLTFALLTLVTRATADESPTVRVDFADSTGKSQTITGQLLVEAKDGGVLVLQPDGRITTVPAEQLTGKQTLEEKFQPLSAEEVGRQLQQELGAGFEIYATEHYVLCSDAGPVFAEGVGDLFERLYDGFRAHFKDGQVTLTEPIFPLPAVVFASRRRFAEYALEDNGPATAQSQGYYSIRTNRIVLYDLSDQPGGDPSRRLAALRANAATVVHEATHQIAFNSGLHTRYSDCPLWLSEGMAMSFETLDPNSRYVTRSIGRTHRGRLRQFIEFVRRRRQVDSLKTLIASNARLTDPATAKDAYSEAWALTHFLSRTKRREYEEFLARMSEKSPLVWSDPAKRLGEFQAVFGDWETLDREFLKYIGRLDRR